MSGYVRTQIKSIRNPEELNIHRDFTKIQFMSKIILQIRKDTMEHQVRCQNNLHQQ